MYFNGDNKDFVVLSRKDAAKFVCQEPYVVISITDPDSPDETLIPNENLKDVCRIKFFDTTKEDDLDLIPFGDDNLKKVLSFFYKWKDDPVLFVVHCEAGISRSAGVASALSLYLNKTDKEFFNRLHPNMLVYRKIVTALFS